jgi:hypothetical protein
VLRPAQLDGGVPWSTKVSRPTLTPSRLYKRRKWSRYRGGTSDAALRDQVRSYVHHSAGLRQPGVHGPGVLCQRLRADEPGPGPGHAVPVRLDAGQVDHPPAKAVPEKVPGLIQRLVVPRAAVIVDDENPAKSLLAELGRQIHEDRAQRTGSDRVGPRPRVSAGQLVSPAGAERDDREDERRPAGSAGDVGRQRVGQPLVHESVREGREVPRMLLQDPSWQDDHGPCAVQGGNLLAGEFRNQKHLGGSLFERDANGQDYEQREKGSHWHSGELHPVQGCVW